MTEPYIGEVQLFGFNFNPPGWAFCNGALVPIAQNTALFSLVGTAYGGNGTTYFNLPTLAGRAACGTGIVAGLAPRALGDAFGTSTVTLTYGQAASHSHTLNAFSTPDPAKRAAGAAAGRALSFLDASTTAKTFAGDAGDTRMSPSMIEPLGSNTTAHENRQPYLAMNFCIALEGIYPILP